MDSNGIARTKRRRKNKIWHHIKIGVSPSSFRNVLKAYSIAGGNNTIKLRHIFGCENKRRKLRNSIFKIRPFFGSFPLQDEDDMILHFEEVKMKTNSL